MRTGFISHPGSGRVRDVPVPDSERELKPLKISLKVSPDPNKTPVFTDDLVGGEGRNRPNFPAVATQICLILLAIQT
jgi:hypothetical protein